MTMPPQAGYSHAPLHRKLGFKPCWRVGVTGAADHCPALLIGAEDALRAAVLPPEWVDAKVCAVDADRSGLELLRRRG